jgi:putative glutamine amidotransferase
MKTASRVVVVYREESEIGPYREALVLAGADPVLAEIRNVPPLSDFDGLLLTGGTDVDPSLYGESPQAQTEEVDPERDAVELRLVEEALRTDLPVLAICRGLQLLNVAHGGDLFQHVEGHRQADPDRATPAHKVVLEAGSLLYSIAGTREWLVNSRHHQAARRIGKGLRVTAIDPADGTIEALERPDQRFMLAVQWHPENQALVDPGQLRIFERFNAAMGVEQTLQD